MTDIDKQLEKLVAIKGGREYVMTRVLIAALLRARKALVFAQAKSASESGHWKRCCAFLRGAIAEVAAKSEAALNDTELEELLR